MCDISLIFIPVLDGNIAFWKFCNSLEECYCSIYSTTEFFYYVLDKCGH